jgi:outer membrane protein OmpA-like peptidoglycan-associated protein
VTREVETSVELTGTRLRRRPTTPDPAIEPVEAEVGNRGPAVDRTAVPEGCRRQVVSTLAHRAGNRAAGMTIQRWGADEHRRLGDDTGMTIDIGDGVELTFGQIVALAGDEFGSLDQLMQATQDPGGRAMIRAHLERAGLPAPSKGTLPAPTAAQEAQASTEYVQLAADNSSHFAGGGTAVEEWLKHHFQAVDLAMQAGLTADPALLNQARMTEAFGAHFLTDAFSSGHIRVPRQAIQDHYVGEVAPRVFDHLVGFLTDHMVEEINDQVYDQQDWYLKPLRGPRRRAIRGAVDEIIAQAITDAGGRATAVRYLGLALAGIVSGAMHDAENRDGLQVISNVHPDPWQAFGDGRLDQDPKHKEQVKTALATSVADLDAAYTIGIDEHQNLFNLPEPGWIPGTVHFEFGQSAATPATTAAIESLALYCRYHPDTVVWLTGHTDPIGKDGDNEELGTARANTVRDILVANGVDDARITTDTRGEKALLTRNPRHYARNRRVEIGLSTDASLVATSETPDDIAARQAQEKLTAQVGPPYLAEDHFPRAAPGLNAELPEWHWGSISGHLRTEMETWVAGYLTQYRGAVLASPQLDARTVEGYTVEPRPIVRRLLDTIGADPVGFLGRALGEDAN